MLALRIEDHVPDLIIEEIRDLGLIQAVEDTSIWILLNLESNTIVDIVHVHIQVEEDILARVSATREEDDVYN